MAEQSGPQATEPTPGAAEPAGAIPLGGSTASAGGRVEAEADPSPAPSAGAGEARPDPLAELEAARARADEYHRNWQRSAADFANFKRRVDEEKRFAERWLLRDLLPVLDDFERAWAALPRELRSLTWIEGVWQVNGKLLAVLQQHGLSPIEGAEGKPFNPLEHEAVLHDEGDPAEQTEVAAELQRGYRLHDRVLRATLVKVGPPKEQGAAGEAGGAESAAATAGDAGAVSEPRP